MPKTSREITRLLQGWCNGEVDALENLMPLVFDDLRRLASRYLRREGFHTLQSTALVHEVFIRLLKRDHLSWKNRKQFFGFVATEMRRILVDHARKKKATRRGSGVPAIPLDEALGVAERQNIDLLDLDDALKELKRLDPELGTIVELRFFVGLSYEEIAEILEISVATARRRWKKARTWLYHELNKKPPPESDSPQNGQPPSRRDDESPNRGQSS